MNEDQPNLSWSRYVSEKERSRKSVRLWEIFGYLATLAVMFTVSTMVMK